MYMYFFFAILFSIANMYLMIAPYFVSIHKKLLVDMIFFSFYDKSQYIQNNYESIQKMNQF